MEKLKLHSPDFTQGNIARLAELFPNCVTEIKDEGGRKKDEKGGGISPHPSSLRYAIDFDQLRQELSTAIVEGPQERYQLNWPGKREALLTANAPIAKTLRPCREESVDFDTTQNLFIEGDNLDALKLLQETYLNKVKMIYIDPPYNTGNDFIYEDNFADDTEAFLQKSNQKDDAGNRLVANTESNGRFHSDWLSMMYSRLKLARNLLREDGVIFISIDDSEQANLKRLCDEVFGEDNFVGALIWQKSKKGDAKLVAKTHEYVLLFARSIESLLAAGIWRRKKPGVDEVLAQYQIFRGQLGANHEAISASMRAWYATLAKDDPRRAHEHYRWSDERGLYFAADFAGPDDGRDSRPRYDIVHPKTGKPCKKPSTGWRWDEKRTNDALAANPPLIHFGVDETTIPCRKSYLHLIDSEPFSSVFYRDGRAGTLELEKLVGKGALEFPKDVETLKDFIRIVTRPKIAGGGELANEQKPHMVRESVAKYSVIQTVQQNDKPQDILLDFFSGSAATAHAVMALNAEDGGKRKFIMVQLPEPCDEKSEAFKAGYKTIAEIGKERIRRAGKKIKDEVGRKKDEKNQELALGDSNSSFSLDPSSLDVGFRALKIDSSNMKDVYYAPDAVQQGDLLAQVDNIREDRTPEDLLFQVLLDWGVDLALPITQESIAGKKVFFVDGNALAACFETGINEEFVKTLAARHPLRAVFRDAGFGSDSVKINIEQIFKLISPTTEVKSI